MSFIKLTLLFAPLLFFCITGIQPCSALEPGEEHIFSGPKETERGHTLKTIKEEVGFYGNGREGFYWGDEKPDHNSRTIMVPASNNSKNIFDNQKEPYKAAERVAEQHESHKTKATVERYKRQLKSQVSKQKRDAYQSAALKQKALNFYY